jgi:very-short-patch-repair endonuclease
VSKSVTPSAEVVRDRAVRLFTYLRELSALRSPVVRELERYERVLWFDELPDDPTVVSIERGSIGTDPDLWLEVRRSDEPRLDDPPEELREWLDLTTLRDSAIEPVLRGDILRDRGGVLETIVLRDWPQVSSAWESYRLDVWQPWADVHRHWTVLYKCYADVFSIHQQIQKLGEAYELVLSLGMLVWNRPTGAIRRHLLCGAAEIAFEAERGVVSVRVSSGGVKLHLENDMVEISDRPSNEGEVLRLIDQISETPWELTSVISILESWVHGASSRGTFHQRGATPRINDDPQVILRPVLVLRKRSGRSLLAAFEKIIADLKAGGDIPTEVERLCTVSEAKSPEDVASVIAGFPGIRGALPDAVYFPLAANDEQLQIADRVRKSAGVLVQGPPGTGKSHTIANLICDLLANGKRVLVTSQTPRALKVLKEKIPKEISPIAVVVLGNDARELGDLEASIGGITNRYAGYNEEQANHLIARLESDLASARGERAAIETRLRDVREADTTTHNAAPGFEGTAMEIAKRVSAQRETFGWFHDRPDKTETLQVELRKLRAALDGLRRFPKDVSAELLKLTLDAGSLLLVSEFAEMVSTAHELTERLEKRRQSGLVDDKLAAIAPGDRARLSAALHEICALIAELNARSEAWLSGARADVIAGRESRWRQLDSDARETLSGLAERATRVQHHDVKLPDGADLASVLADSSDLLAHLRSGGSLGFWVIQAKAVRRAGYLIRNARMNGRTPASVETLESFVDYIQTQVAVRRAWAVWEGLAEGATGPLPRLVREIEQHHAALSPLLGLHSALQHARTVLNRNLIEHPRWEDIDNVTLLIERLESVLIVEDLEKRRAALQDFSSGLARETADPRRHPIVSELAAAVAAQDSLRYATAVAKLEEIHRNVLSIRARDEFLSGARTQLRNLVSSFSASPENADWEERFESIPAAWDWARASAWLEHFDKTHQIATLESAFQRTNATIASTVALLAAEKAWQHCFRRMTEEQRQHLVAWGKVVKKIGKASKYAVQRRKEAQGHIDKCRGAVPAWIMPFHRVAETISPVPEQFDVVIVDEASQSGPETLLLTYIAKQIIIVGDDKQIAPEYVGVNEESVNQLIARHLADFDLGNTFGLRFSLFEHGEIRYGNRIVLREHFRCMPEIIRFSNDLSYRDTPLIPLRQYPAKRLDPILVTHVETGYREGGPSQAMNRPEATAIVEAIVALADPRYEGKTFGVISLQGDMQAQLIERELVKRLPPKDIELRRLVCGDAYAFQGDERDVMFLSMVAAPNTRIGPLTKETDQRRFNVAASRARDQMWLFHTARTQDLNPDDMRARLLRYMQNPASTANQEPDFSKCDSQFEIDVARELYAREYRFFLQYEPFGPSGRRIDIVAEGAKARLAIECDGDHWHGPDRWDHDMARQRQLERCGWTFWRIRGSEFYADRVAAVDALIRELDRMGIHPGAADRPATPPTGSGPISNGAREETKVDEPRVERPDPLSDFQGIFDRDASAWKQNDAFRLADARLPIGAAQDVPFSVWPRDDEDEGDETPNSVDSPVIDDVAQHEIRAAFDQILSAHSKLPREEFLRLAANALGFQRLGKKIRKRLNHALGGEIRSGRLVKDWEFVVRADTRTNREA